MFGPRHIEKLIPGVGSRLSGLVCLLMSVVLVQCASGVTYWKDVDGDGVNDLIVEKKEDTK